ncbi:MAG: efflux transporter outer membrane subunit [Akkermansiaceae bacterium]
MSSHTHRDPRSIISLICLSLLGLSACHPGGAPSDQPTVDVPTAWEASANSNSSTARISTSWVKDFNDPALSKLIQETMKANPGLLASTERLRAARASVVSSRADLFPSISATGSTSRSRTNADEAGGSTSYSGSRSLRASASWQIDLWGRLRNLSRASLADYESTIADFRATRLSLAASTASLWYDLISATNQVKLAENTLDSYQTVKQIIERNYKAGTARSIDLQLSRNNVFNAERVLRVRLRRRDDARRDLEVILGRYPTGKIRAPSNLPTIRPSIPVGVPADMIARRPDIVQARQQLNASFERALAAQKNLLPSLSLSGSSGTSPSSLSQLLDIGYLTSSISSSISQTIFDAGEKREDAIAAVARNQAEIHDYANIALSAFREVESALASEKWLKEQELYLRKELEQAALAEKQTERDYAEGVDGIDIIDLLETQRRASNARSSLIDLQNQRIQNRINLHLALGGDFFTSS